jgi:hypothetical protein
MISFFNFATSSLLEVAVESGKIDSMPTPIPLRCRLLKEIYADTEYSEKVNDMMDLFILLRKINLVENYDSINEYRRHVAMISEIEGEEVIDKRSNLR